MMHSHVLGVVLAGGQSRRFGSDKALAVVDGHTLLDRAVLMLGRQCDVLVVAGRDAAPIAVVADHPRAGLGPLGGLCGALRYGEEHGFDAVLSIPVDAFDLPADLLAELLPAPAYVHDAPVIGVWPVAARQALDALLAEDTTHSMRAFAARIGARSVRLSRMPANVNTPADLAAAKDHAHGL